MKKIPVKIVQYTINGETRKNVMIDMIDTYDIEGDAETKIKNFKKKYFETIDKAKKIFHTKQAQRKTTEFWKLGKILSKLKESTSNQFIITNYYSSLQRDFLFTSKYLRMILEFGNYFEKNEVLNLIKFSYYMELIQKRKILEKSNQFEKEKKRLLKMGKANTLPGLLKYRAELINLTKIPQKPRVKKFQRTTQSKTKSRGK